MKNGKLSENCIIVPAKSLELFFAPRSPLASQNLGELCIA